MKKSPNEWTGLKRTNCVLLGGIFANGAQPDVELSSLQNQFYKNLPNIKNCIFDALMERGYFQHRPDYVRSGYVGGGIAMGVVLFVLGNALAQKWEWRRAVFHRRDSFGCDHRWIRLVHAGAHGRGRKSFRGSAGLRGFSDARRSRSHGPHQRKRPRRSRNFCRSPWRWAWKRNGSARSRISIRSRRRGTRAAFTTADFIPIMFVSSLDNMTARASSVMASAPRSSGGSGFGGGGSSGGGFGGGGGGGF
jgi:hypothetical protein